jgi:hypothetical protein
VGSQRGPTLRSRQHIARERRLVRPTGAHVEARPSSGRDDLAITRIFGGIEANFLSQFYTASRQIAIYFSRNVSRFCTASRQIAYLFLLCVVGDNIALSSRMWAGRFPHISGKFLSASVGNRAAVEHSPVVCPLRVWVTKCVVRMLVGRQISHISQHFLLPWAWQFPPKIQKMRVGGKRRLAVHARGRRGRCPARSRHQRDPLTWKTRVRIGTGVSTALNFLHRSEGTPIYHRDVTAANVCISADVTPKLINCGVSMIIDEERARTGVTSYTATGDLAIGTAEYMCPKYARSKKYGEKAEVSLLALCSSSCLSGEATIQMTCCTTYSSRTPKRTSDPKSHTVPDWGLRSHMSL